MSQNPKASPNLPWIPWLLMTFLAFLVDLTCRLNITVNRRLFNLFDFKAPASKKPINGVATSDIKVDPSRNLWFRLYTPYRNLRWRGGAVPACLLFSTSMVEDFATWLQIHLALIGIAKAAESSVFVIVSSTTASPGASTSMSTRRWR
ncbi:hypothetical protein Patl1_07300 [Pistacia atlantica]|uniref:Uncharacterized protein n=1 Tax=Pistacia atlantica TaxID=434234 RepID=A0ACC1AID2_9ROSI|nr:hypothetical protein Patl1_07300 [Pistacia atlantica]